MGWLRRRSHTLKVIHDKLKFQLSQRNALEFIEPWNFWAFSISLTLHFSDPLLSEIHIGYGESFSLTCIFFSNSSFIFFSAIIDFCSSIWALFRAMCLALLLDIRAPKSRVEVCCRILFYIFYMLSCTLRYRMISFSWVHTNNIGLVLAFEYLTIQRCPLSAAKCRY